MNWRLGIFDLTVGVDFLVRAIAFHIATSGDSLPWCIINNEFPPNSGIKKGQTGERFLVKWTNKKE